MEDFPATSDRSIRSTEPEDIFAELFTAVFGPERTLLLSPQHSVTDIYGGSRYVDFALRVRGEKIAFEIDGLTWHSPELIPGDKYEDDLLRQNSLIYQNWRVYRWTDRQIAGQPEKVKEELALFLEKIDRFLPFEDFLPRQSGEFLKLREHQEEALRILDRMRAENKTIALLEHPTGSGKTVTAIQDAKKHGGRTLWLVHRRDLVNQTQKEFRKHWPEVDTGRYFGGTHDSDAFNLVASIRSIAENLDKFGPHEFAYLVIDEAHHAASETYRRILEHFQPDFILGMTATSDRSDGFDLLELFRDSAHRLTLQEAVERGELAPIRCVRVKTNVDLSRIRYNQIQYNRRDIEEKIAIPSRDRLIVSTYLDHVPDRKAVAFAVNVNHGEQLAKTFLEAGVPSKSISGRMPYRERDSILRDFQNGQIRVLCACDILNEGWNCPDVEVLLMARPTLSKVVYLQQLGRGTRKSPGKECLIVFDFIDNATRYNQSLSAHRVLGINRYRPGGLLIAPSDDIESDERAFDRNQKPTTAIEIGLWTRDFEPIDIFDWQQQMSAMISSFELDRELGVGSGRIRTAVERGDIRPDHTITLGDRTHYWFNRDRIDEIRETIGAPRMDAHGIRDRFLAFVTDMDMSLSYKPVMLLCLLQVADEKGRAKSEQVARKFRQFYAKRYDSGLIVEKPGSRKIPINELDETEILRLMLGMPFEKFERRRFLKYDSDLSVIRFEQSLWRQLESKDIQSIRDICNRHIEDYYARFESD